MLQKRRTVEREFRGFAPLSSEIVVEFREFAPLSYGMVVVFREFAPLSYGIAHGLTDLENNCFRPKNRILPARAKFISF